MWRAAMWGVVTKVGSGKSDVYLFCRSLGGALKASLHESGSWHLGFLRDFAEESFDVDHPRRKDPYIEIWPRPSAIAGGLVLAYRILVPSSGVSVPITGEEPSSIIWLPAAPNGKATEVLIILASKAAKITSWPGATSMGTQLAGRMGLDNGDTAWVVHHVVDVPEVQLPTGSTSWFQGKSKDDLAGASLRAVVFGSSADGSRIMIDTAVEVPGEGA